MTLVERLEANVAKFEEIFADGKITLLEGAETVSLLSRSVAETIAEYQQKPTEAEGLAMFNEGWVWIDTRFRVIEQMDKVTTFEKLPLYLKPFKAVLEANDGPFYRWIIEEQFIPRAAKKLF